MLHSSVHLDKGRQLEDIVVGMFTCTALEKVGRSMLLGGVVEVVNNYVYLFVVVIVLMDSQVDMEVRVDGMVERISAPRHRDHLLGELHTTFEITTEVLGKGPSCSFKANSTPLKPACWRKAALHRPLRPREPAPCRLETPTICHLVSEL